MSKLRMIIRNISIIVLMVILITPATVHAHTLDVLGAEITHAADGGCHDADNDPEQGSNDDHQLDARCCELDAPYVLPPSQSLATPAATGILVFTFNGGQLDGYARRIYKPPRKPHPVSQGEITIVQVYQ